MGYKYKLDDIDCNYCTKKGSLGCYYSLCPHIMSNLSSLFSNSVFREAVKNAENNKTPQKNTLNYLKKQAIRRGYDLFDEEKTYRCEYKPDCEKCNYFSVGFICYNQNDGTCLIDWIRMIENAGRK